MSSTDLPTDPAKYSEQVELPFEPGVRSLFAFTSPKLAKLSDEELADHIVKVRDEAYAIAPWPCFGSFRFLVPGTRSGPPKGTYEAVLERLKADPNAKILDIGCGFGQDVRGLLQDGVRPNQIVAVDLLPELMALGCKAFGDENGKGHLEGVQWKKLDVFEKDEVQAVRALTKDGAGFDAIYAGSCIHLFTLEKQKVFAQVLASLLSRKPGSVLFGRQVGSPEGQAGPFPVPPGWEERGMEPPYAHDRDSFPKLFNEIPESEGGGAWDFNVQLTQWEAPRQGRPRLSFAVSRASA